MCLCVQRRRNTMTGTALVSPCESLFNDFHYCKWRCSETVVQDWWGSRCNVKTVLALCWDSEQAVWKCQGLDCMGKYLMTVPHCASRTSNHCKTTFRYRTTYYIPFPEKASLDQCHYPDWFMLANVWLYLAYVLVLSWWTITTVLFNINIALW